VAAVSRQTKNQKYLNRQIPQVLKRMEICYKSIDKKKKRRLTLKHHISMDPYLQEYYQTHDTERSGNGKILLIKFLVGTHFHKDKTRA
jgi:hypothetical protein